MAAREDEAQLVVFEQFRQVVGPGGFVGQRFADVRPVFEMIEALLATLLVDRFEPSRGDQPRGGILRNPFSGPLLHGRAKGVAERLLGAVEVAKQADQRRQDAPRFLPIEGFDLRANSRDLGCWHRRMLIGTVPVSHQTGTATEREVTVGAPRSVDM